MCFLSAFLITDNLYAQTNCGYFQTGFNKKINGRTYCVLDNSMRECAAIVNPCPVE